MYQYTNVYCLLCVLLLCVYTNVCYCLYQYTVYRKNQTGSRLKRRDVTIIIFLCGVMTTQLFLLVMRFRLHNLRLLTLKLWHLLGKLSIPTNEPKLYFMKPNKFSMACRTTWLGQNLSICVFRGLGSNLWWNFDSGENHSPVMTHQWSIRVMQCNQPKWRLKFIATR